MFLGRESKGTGLTVGNIAESLAELPAKPVREVLEGKIALLSLVTRRAPGIFAFELGLWWQGTGNWSLKSALGLSHHLLRQYL